MKNLRGILKRKDWRYLRKHRVDKKFSRKTKKRLQTSARAVRERLYVNFIK